MSDLPDDIRDWPSNCFKVFGLSRSVSNKELRRSYFRLIKKYKPDTHPAKFQRIHEAYEQARDILAAGEGFDESAAFWDDAEPQIASNQQQSQPAHSRKPVGSPELVPAGTNNDEAIADDSDRFWELASKGLIDEPMALLPNITSQRNRELAGFSEYFLRRASTQRHAPDESSQRVAVLLKHLDHPHLGQTAIYYLRNEFECKPELARLDSVQQYIRNSEHSESAHELAKTRWKAVGQQDPNLVVADMMLLREKFTLNVEHTALEALEYTIWYGQDEFKHHNEACQQIVNESQSNGADVADVLAYAVKEFATKATAWSPNDIGSLIPKARTGFTSRMKADWSPMVERLNHSHQMSLLKLEAVAKHRPICLTIFNFGLERFSQQSWDSGYIDGHSYLTINAEIESFLKQNRIRKYNQRTRLLILEFCIENVIDPRIFGELTDQFTQGNQESLWSEVLKKDISLSCVYNAGVASQI